MSRFPDTIEFTRLNRPIGIEWSVRNLEVQGSLPPEIRGAFFRAVPDPAFAPLHPDDSILSGDGMISCFRFADGAVDHEIRYLRTPRYEAERRARRALFGRYRNPFTDLPEVHGIDRAVANTAPIWHGGRLLMTKEDALAYEVNPHTLYTVGAWTYDGRLRSSTMTAHPRIDPATGAMFMFGYEAGGPCSRDVAYFVADCHGELVSEQWFKAPYCSLMHDFAITENWVIFTVFPTTTDIQRLRAGGVHWTHDSERESWVGVMPRHGSVRALRWLRGPAGVFAFHLINAFEADGLLHLDLCLADSQPLPFIRAPSGIAGQPVMQTVRWSFDPKGGESPIQSRVIAPPGDLPRIRSFDQGRPYRHFWMPGMDPSAGAPVPGGPAGVSFNCLMRVEPDSGRVDKVNFGPGTAVNEPVHVPSSHGSDGWLLVVVDQEIDPQRHISELLVLDATDISAAPLARVRLPVPLHPQIHGCWVPEEELARSRRIGRR